MTQAVIFPNIEKLLIAALKPLFSVPFSTEVPATRPPSFVRLTRVGGPRRDVVTEQPMVVFEAWALTALAAGDLGRELQAHVFALAQTDHPTGYVRSVHEVGGLQSFPDPVSSSPRYQFTVQLQTRGVPL